MKDAADAANLIIIEDAPIAERDYTGGQAAELYKELRNKGVVLPSHQVIDFLANKFNLGNI